MDWAAIGIWTLVIILFLVGFLGTILPAVPGVILVFVGTLVYAFFDGFHSVSVGWIVGFGVMTALAMGTDYVAGIVGAKKFKASRWGIIGSIAGLIVGLFFGPRGSSSARWRAQSSSSCWPGATRSRRSAPAGGRLWVSSPGSRSRSVSR